MARSGFANRKLGRGGVAVALSAVFHAAVLGGLILAARGPGAPPPKPPIVLELLRPAPAKPHKAPTPPLGGAPNAHAKAQPTRTAPPLIAPVALPPPDLGPPVVAQVTPIIPPPVRKALRAGIGCDHADFLKLSEAERAACEHRLVVASPRDIAKVFVVSDPRKRAEFDKAAAKDEAWRRYRDSTSMDGYPGLHTLLGH